MRPYVGSTFPMRLGNTPRATPAVFYNTWSHAYAIHALVRMLERLPDDHERREAISKLIDQVKLLKHRLLVRRQSFVQAVPVPTAVKHADEAFHAAK